MFDEQHSSVMPGSQLHIQPNSAAPPVVIPPGHIGEVMLPGTGRLIWWTGRVAIGLRHEPVQRTDAITMSALWLQDLLCNTHGRRSAA